MANYNFDDTIAALSTAAGKSAIAVIRVSGEHSHSIAEKIFKFSSHLPVIPEGNCRGSAVTPLVKHGYIVDGDNKIDEAICAFFTAPHTYTGENLVEISTHGNPVIINEVLNLLYKTGARQVNPGEFTYRAFINGKMDLAKAALNNVSGEFSQKINALCGALVNLLAYMEVSLDHPEEDIMFLSREEKTGRLAGLIKTTQKLIDTYKISQALQKGLNAAIIGKPNAGKSSLLNAILGKNRAIVTDIAGTTTDTIEEFIDCRGIPLTIIDTAGIRNHNANTIEKLGQEKTKETLSKADIIICVLDASTQFDDNDKQIEALLKTVSDTPIIYVANKSDIAPNPVILSGAKNPAVTVKLSAKTGEGIPELLDAVAKTAGQSETPDDLFIINARHFAHLSDALDALKKASLAYAQTDSDEIAAFETRRALENFNAILGIDASRDILDTIFSQFCIGK